MAVSAVALPFGLRQVKLVPLNAAGVEVPANAQFLPASRTFSFSEAEDFENLDGDDRRWASHGAGPTVEWDLEGGGISLELWAILSGATITTTASQKKLTKLVTDQRPYFNVYGRAISDSGGDFQMVVYRCKADGSLEASMENGSFLLTSCSGTGFGEDKTTNAKLYDFVQNETAVPFDPATGKTAWNLTVSGTPTGGSFKLAVNGVPTADIAYNANAAAVAAALSGISGVTGVTFSGTGTTPIALTATPACNLSVYSQALTGGTTPGVAVA